MTEQATQDYPKLVPEAPPAPDEREAGGSDVMPRILRALGAVLLVVAASSFMFRDWGQHDDVTRYLMLLGQLGLLAAAGFFCGLKLEEKRGARTFLGLVIAVIPVHFAVLGGVLYSQLALDNPESHLATHAIWQAGDATTAIGLILGAQLLIIPATFVAMMTLARRHAGKLTLAFLAVCATLLVPLREPNVMALFILGLTPALLFLQLRIFSGTATLSTPQGRFVRAMLTVPLLVIIGRTLLYYEPTAPLVGVTLFALALTSFVHDVRADGARGLARFAVPQMFAIAGMCLGWTIVAADFVLPHVLNGGVQALDWPLMLLPWTAIILVASAFTARGTLNYRRLAALVAALVVCLNVASFNELLTGLLALGVGVALGLYGARVRQKAVIVVGSLTALFGLVIVAILTIRIEALTHWGSLTAVGVALIFGAALLDRNRQHLLRRLTILRGRMRGWSY